MRYFYTTLLIVFAALLPVESAHADRQVQEAKQCTAYIPSMERKYGIPAHLLSAISSMESGKYHKNLKIMLPTPWTINVEGKGYYLNSKAEAIAKVRKYQSQGVKSIDVGCMQVNLKHHSNAFANLEQAFDPKHNVQYAASFLRRLYEEEKSWRKAAAGYHSKTPSKGSKYVARIFRAWENIITRLRLSKQQTIKQADASFDGKDIIRGNGRSKPVRISRKAKEPAKKHEQVKMKVIEVANAPNHRKSDIILIKPDISQTSAVNAYQRQPNVMRVDNSSRWHRAPKGKLSIVRLDPNPIGDEVTVASAIPPSLQPATKKSGPRFIFTD